MKLGYRLKVALFGPIFSSPLKMPALGPHMLSLPIGYPVYHVLTSCLADFCPKSSCSRFIRKVADHL
jgi:hypothetical protein